MRFGPVAVADAAGAVLAHGTAGLRKGQILTDADCAALHRAGLGQVIVARLDADDLGEDDAAAALAAAIVPDPAGQGLRIGPAATGRVNLHATGPGIIAVDTGAVARINAVHPMLTLATVPPWHRCDLGAMVATVKVISYGVPAPAVALAVAGAAGALRRLPPQITSASLIETVIPGHDPGPKGRAALTGRLDRLGVALHPVIESAHDATALATALATAQGDILFILTASATSDPGDVGPAAVVAAGGRIERFGMPVDPGNLLFLGRIGRRPVIGLPGCARSPALNGADWVLERVICGAAPTAGDIAAMGVGGLLKEIPTRPRLRDPG